MKAILEFNLPEEEEDHRGALNAVNYWLVLWDLNGWLRGELKHNDKLDDKTAEVYESIREKMSDLMVEHHVSLDDFS